MPEHALALWSDAALDDASRFCRAFRFVWRSLPPAVTRWLLRRRWSSGGGPLIALAEDLTPFTTPACQWAAAFAFCLPGGQTLAFSASRCAGLPDAELAALDRSRAGPRRLARHADRGRG